MVILNFHIAKELLSNSVGYFKNWQCEPLVFSEDQRSVAIASAIWWFYISKAVEMLAREKRLLISQLVQIISAKVHITFRTRYFSR